MTKIIITCDSGKKYEIGFDCEKSAQEYLALVKKHLKENGTLISEGISGFYGKEIGEFPRTYSITN